MARLHPTLLLVLIMTGVVATGVATSMVALYRTALDQQRQRLTELLTVQALLVEAFYHHEAAESWRQEDLAGDPLSATLASLKSYHDRFPGLGETGEFTLARREGDAILFLLSHRHGQDDTPAPVAWEDVRAEPMRQALTGRSGLLVGRDYRGQEVLAAYRYLPDLGLGMVAKIDLVEIRTPFLRAGALAALAVLVALLFGTLLFRRIVHPLIRNLEENRRRLQTLMDNLPGMAYRCRNDPHWTMELVSAGCRELTGHPPEALTGNRLVSFNDLIHPDDRQRVWNSVQEAVRAGRVFELEYRLCPAIGETKTVWEKGRGVFADNGELRALEGLVMDVSEARQALDALRERNEFIETLTDSLPIGLAVHTIDDEHFRYMNPKFEEIYGWKWKAIPVVDAFFKHVYPDPDYRAEIAARVRADMASGDPQRMIWENIPVTRSSGETAFVTAQNIPMFESNLMISTVWDVTERKRAEDALKASEERYRRYFELGQIGMAITSPETGWVEVNDRLCDIFGYSREELKQMTWVELTHPADIERDLAEFNRLLRGEADEYTLEKRFIRRDGLIIHGFIAATCVRRPDGSPDYFVALVQDITPQKKAELELKKTVADLQRSNAELEQFAYVASHDLQEPLRMVTSYVQLLQRRYQGRLDGDAEEFIGFAVDGAARMKQLINDLLDFSRVGRSGEPFQVVSMEETLREVSRNLQEVIAENRAVITHDPLPRVTGDPVLLARLLQNLISNAIKFRAEAPPEVHVGATPLDGSWQFSVQDNGPGIDPRYFDKLFVIFQRLHGKEIPGTGIGLATCKKIVEHHGGRIWVASEPGRGATFHFTLKGGPPDHDPDRTAH